VLLVHIGNLFGVRADDTRTAISRIAQ